MKILLVSGFLGAGKTTFIKELAKNINLEFVVLENEYADIGVDKDFLDEKNLNVWEMSEGCICCSMKGDFKSSIKRIYSEINPEYLVVEPTGVGMLSSIIENIRDINNNDIDITEPWAQISRSPSVYSHFGGDIQIQTGKPMYIGDQEVGTLYCDHIISNGTFKGTGVQHVTVPNISFEDNFILDDDKKGYATTGAVPIKVIIKAAGGNTYAYTIGAPTGINKTRQVKLSEAVVINTVTEESLKGYIDSKVTDAFNKDEPGTPDITRRAPTALTLDRSSTPWTVWFDNGCGLQAPEYGTTATIMGYGYNDTANNQISSYPITYNFLKLSNGSVSFDDLSNQSVGSCDYYADSTKIINPVRNENDYDWSNAFFSDAFRQSATWETKRQKNFLRCAYALGIGVPEDYEKLGAKKKS